MKNAALFIFLLCNLCVILINFLFFVSPSEVLYGKELIYSYFKFTYLLYIAAYLISSIFLITKKYHSLTKLSCIFVSIFLSFLSIALYLCNIYVFVGIYKIYLCILVMDVIVGIFYYYCSLGLR